MTRKIFFSFHYERDAWRAGQVRNSDMIPNEDEYGFIDAAAWEEIKRQGDAAIERWILDQLNGTSVTVVLIGAETAQRPWVDFEIRESWKRGNAIISLYIHNVKDSEGKTDMQGVNPLDNVYLENGQPLSSVCSTYDWVLNDGRNNLGSWADQAAQLRAQYKGETALKPGTASSSVNTPPRSSYTPTGPTVINNPSGPWAY
ncbi:MAG: TIR domain-containing protein [Patescibacteria group bacterium]